MTIRNLILNSFYEQDTNSLVSYVISHRDPDMIVRFNGSLINYPLQVVIIVGMEELVAEILVHRYIDQQIVDHFAKLILLTDSPMSKLGLMPDPVTIHEDIIFPDFFKDWLL